MNSYNFFTTSTNGKFSHYGPLNIDSNLRPHQMVRHSSDVQVSPVRFFRTRTIGVFE